MAPVFPLRSATQQGDALLPVCEIVAVWDAFPHRGCSLRFMNENPETDANNTAEQELSEELFDDVSGGVNGLDINIAV